MHRTCFLMGHRDTPESVFPLLKEAVFFSRPGKRRVGIHRGQSRGLRPHGGPGRLRPEGKRPACQKQPLPPGFDGSFYPNLPENLPPRFAMVQANH